MRYYKPAQENPADHKLMDMMDKEFLEHPTKGVLGMVDFLRAASILIGPKRVRRLLRKMGVMALYPKRNLSKLGLAQYIHSYKLRGLQFTHSNHVWCIDISYIPMQKGFLYLTAIIDVYSRYIVGWDISNTLDAENSLKVLRKAISDHGKPDIVNSDQGSQFTCPGWVEYLKKEDITISMDGKGRALDNIWIERFWRTIKQEYVYICPAENGNMLRRGLKKFIDYYNNRRQHRGLGRKTPFTWYEYAA
jgi:putative transposase